MKQKSIKVIEELIKEDEERIPVMSKWVLNKILRKIQEHSGIPDIKDIDEVSSTSCYAVAKMVSDIINDPDSNTKGESYQCTKIFAYGRRIMRPSEELEWENHEAVLVKISQKKKWNYGNYIVTKVIDPLISKKAIYIDEWIGTLISLRNNSRADVSYDEPVLSFMIFPSFFLKPKRLTYSDLYSNFKLVKDAVKKDMINTAPLVREKNVSK